MSETPRKTGEAQAPPPAATHAEQAAEKRPDLSDEERRQLAEAASREEDA